MSAPCDMSQVWLSGMDALGVITRRHFYCVDDIKGRWFAADPAARYTAISNVVYDKRLGGLILQPDATLRNLPSAGLTIAAGGASTRDCTPPALGVTCPMYYSAAPNADPSVYTWQLAGGYLSAGPWIVHHLIRTPAPPVGQTADSQRWKLGFGGLTLTWGRYTDPVLTDGTGAEISRYTLNEGDRERFAFDTIQRWEITSLGGELYISCSGFSGDWTTVYPTLPAAAWSFAANGGKCAINLTPVTFAASGYVITPLIEEGYPYPDGDLSATTWPTNAAPTSAAISVETVSGTQKSYRLALSTTDTLTTPIVRTFETGYAPEFAALSVERTEISDYFVKGREILTQDYSARNTTLTFRETEDFIAAVGRLSGHRVITYATGYDAGDGVAVRQTRMTGIMGAVERTGHDVTLSVYDRWTQLAKVRLFNAPMLLGLTRAAAISLIAQCAGIPTELISVNADVTGTIGDGSRPFGEEGARWRIPDLTSAADAIRKILTTYGLKADFDGYGVLCVYRSEDTAVTNDYSAVDGTDDRYGLGTDPFEGVAFKSDLTGAINHHVVIGECNGQPIIAAQYDPASVADPMSERYMGYYATDGERIPDLDTAAEVQEAVAKRLQAADIGLPKVVLSNNRAYALCHEIPRTFISGTDPDIDFTMRRLKILEMTVDIDETIPPVTSMLLEVQP